jgi:hypothetical protein
MQNAVGIGPLILKVIVTGSIGWMLATLLRVLGNREMATFMKIITIILCITACFDLIAVIGRDIKDFADTINKLFEPIVRLIELLEKYHRE